MRKVAFLPDAFEDFNYWTRENSKIHAKIVDLIKDIQRSPFGGLGKPEPLKRELQGMWSRRVTEEHRLVYKLTDEEIIIISCRYHYRD